ncbi:MAG: hypothetical protein GDA40_06480 [Rhodobacteraceae bacterium]|nr:hypothetical protein [Paracoccaceae bacterium]
MGRVFKVLSFLIVAAVLGLLAYTYAGPFLGADFSAPTREIRQPILLNAT